MAKHSLAGIKSVSKLHLGVTDLTAMILGTKIDKSILLRHDGSSFTHFAVPRFSSGRRFAGLPDDEMGRDAKISELKPPDKKSKRKHCVFPCFFVF